jgi:ubiquinone/menaquinone biosynthesis C-methylase UbiE
MWGILMPSKNTTFKDHFSSLSTGYSRFRPSYSSGLFKYLSSLTPGHELAWDCATGTGQAAVALADLYQKVIATDASSQQIERAHINPSVEYRVAVAENSGLDAGSIDLVTVAQALH